MKSKHKHYRPHGLAILVGLGLAANAVNLRAAPASPASPGNPAQGPSAGSMPPPESVSKADPMAEYQRLGKPNNAPARATAVAKASILAAAPARTYLHCVFKLKRDGSYRLERAVQVDGDPLVSDEAAGPLIAEVSKGTEVVSIQANADPFEKRGFPSQPGKGPEGHHFESDEESEVVVKIPNAALADTDLNKLTVRMYKWQENEAVEHVDRESFKEYKRLNRVRGWSEIPGKFLRQEIGDKGIIAPK